MKKSGKVTIVEELSAQFGRATMTLVSEYRGLTAAESTDLRRRVREVAGEVKVAKNTLVRLAIKETPYAGLDQQLGGPVIIIFCYGDALTLAKAVLAIRELGDKFKLRGGILGGQPLSSEELRAFATLPPREVIIAQLLGLLQAPATGLVRLLNEPGSLVARLIDAIGKQRSSTEAEPIDNAAPAQEAAGA
ncbi:MAG: 50S ribosomal protein L10 [Candidatus Binataceae bacterium]|nr:50S ribosomal protein L10 [Candidatus Binataceae bacterium]